RRDHQSVVVPFADDDLWVAGLVHCDVAGLEFQRHPCYGGKVPADRFTPVQTGRYGQGEGVLDQRVLGIQFVKRLPPSMRNPIDKAFEDFSRAGWLGRDNTPWACQEPRIGGRSSS